MIGLLIRLGEIASPGQDHILIATRQIAGGARRISADELRLIGEDRRNRGAEMIADGGAITLMRNGDERLDRLGIQTVDIALMVEPVGATVDLVVAVPELFISSGGLAFS